MKFHTLIRTFSRLWQLVIVFSLLGTAAAWLFAASHPPIYEGIVTASFGLQLDQQNCIDERSRDLTEMDTQGLLLSEDVLNSALESMEGTYPEYTDPAKQTDLRGHVFIERRLSDWALTARSEDRAFLEDFMPAWGSAAQDAFDEAYLHALSAKAFAAQLALTNGDLALMAASGKPEDEYRVILNRLSEQQAELLVKVAEETAASHGVSTFLSLRVDPTASVSEKPVTRDRAGLLVAGTAAGFMISLILITLFSLREESQIINSTRANNLPKDLQRANPDGEG